MEGLIKNTALKKRRAHLPWETLLRSGNAQDVPNTYFLLEREESRKAYRIALQLLSRMLRNTDIGVAFSHQ